MSLNFEVFSHATEDPKKVRKALANVMPRRGRIEKKVVPGEWGNIIIFRSELKTRLKELFKKLNPIFRKFLEKTLDERTDKKRIFLRFDKEEAYRGNLVLSETNDVVHVTAEV